MAAPVSTKIPQAAVFLVPIPKLLVLLLSFGDLPAGKFVVEAFCSKFPKVPSSLPKLLVVHSSC